MVLPATRTLPSGLPDASAGGAGSLPCRIKLLSSSLFNPLPRLSGTGFPKVGIAIAETVNTTAAKFRRNGLFVLILNDRGRFETGEKLGCGLGTYLEQRTRNPL